MMAIVLYYRFTKRCAEVNIINKILQSKQDTIKHLNKQLEIKDKELARGTGGLHCKTIDIS